MASTGLEEKVRVSRQFTEQSRKLSLSPSIANPEGSPSTEAFKAKFITPHDVVIETANGGRLPAVPITEAEKLNQLGARLEGGSPSRSRSRTPQPDGGSGDDAKSSTTTLADFCEDEEKFHVHVPESPSASLGTAIAPSKTDPLLPPLPIYGPASTLRTLQFWTFRASSFLLSTSFLLVIVLGSVFTSIPLGLHDIRLRLQSRDPNARRPFYEEEKRRQKAREEAERAWEAQRESPVGADICVTGESGDASGHFRPTEGGKDRLISDIGYYARRVGLDVEEFNVVTEDGFNIALWHVFDPNDTSQEGKYPVLLIHGLLQSAGTYCCTDDDSLAFFLCKSGYDVWLGNNRCGFTPSHTLLKPSDPRMWAWNIRQMGVLDIPAHVDKVLSETGFAKLGLVCHSQGTTETFVALAKEQRPDLGNKLSVFCALAPAVYAGSLIEKMYFKFMRVISPSFFRVFFGIHSFIPLMMVCQRNIPGTLYGAMGYRVFSFLFSWTDDRWDRGVRDRCFIFAPVYVSAESMRWWLGRECFAKQKCILATRAEGEVEDKEDGDLDEIVANTEGTNHMTGVPLDDSPEAKAKRERLSWYDGQFPPLAMWVCGADNLVDGRRLLKRFERGREPYVNVVHTKVIEEYEHLDVIWAMDSIDQVGKEVREVLWRTAPRSAREKSRTPLGCEGVTDYVERKKP